VRTLWRLAALATLGIAGATGKTCAEGDLPDVYRGWLRYREEFRQPAAEDPPIVRRELLLTDLTLYRRRHRIYTLERKPAWWVGFERRGNSLFAAGLGKLRTSQRAAVTLVPGAEGELYYLDIRATPAYRVRTRVRGDGSRETDWLHDYTIRGNYLGYYSWPGGPRIDATVDGGKLRLRGEASFTAFDTGAITYTIEGEFVGSGSAE
jgi:hypothetical protein